MPQLVKGGKWVFGWVIVGPSGTLTIPPEARDEYGFRVGDEVIFFPGSRSSGGFAVAHARLLATMSAPLQAGSLGRGFVDERGRVKVSVEVEVKPSDRLLAVRGSGRALGFVARGPIYDEALRHDKLRYFR
jgi:hypothetical protein